MPKSKSYVSSSDDSETEVAPKRKNTEKSEEAESSKKPKKSKQDNADPSWDIGNNRFVKIREFKGKMYVDIREMYLDKDAELKPGKKGISLNMVQWQKFMEHVKEIDQVAKSKC